MVLTEETGHLPNSPALPACRPKTRSRRRLEPESVSSFRNSSSLNSETLPECVATSTTTILTSTATTPVAPTTTLIPIKVVVLGSERVGKTDFKYTHVQDFDEDALSFEMEILDTCTAKTDLNRECTHIGWADACVVVFSIADSESFIRARQIVHRIRQLKKPHPIPVLLLGNKCDLEHLRQVETDHAQKVAREVRCFYEEVSASEQLFEIHVAFSHLFREIRNQYMKSLAKRRNSFSIVSKAFSSLFYSRRPRKDGAGRRKPFTL